MITLLIAAPLAVASEDSEEDKAATDKSGGLFSPANFEIRVGAYKIDSTTEIRVDALDGRIGTTINLESDLNLDERKSTPYLSIRWRMSGKHFLELEQFNLERSGEETLSAELEFGDEVFEIGALVNSFFDTKVTRLSYSYKFYDSARSRVAFSAGLHRTSLATGISDVVGQYSAEQKAVAEVTAPLPVIGISGSWKFNERWSVAGRAQIFRLSIAEYSGRLDHAAANLEYDPFKYVGFGLGYDLFSINLDIEEKHWQGSVRYRFHGPLLYIKGHF